MKIRVTEVLFVENTIRVNFCSSVGAGTATWVGTAPTIGDEQDVEFDLDEVFSWGENIVPSTLKAPCITVINGVTQITAELVEDSSEESAALKLGDSIILMELDEATTRKTGFV